MAAKRNDKPMLFAAEYLADLHGTNAAIRAGYSARTAGQVAYKLLQRTDVQEWIQAERQRIAEKLSLKAEDVLSNIARLSAKAEARNDFNAAIRGQELIGKHLKLFTEKHEHGGIGGGPIVVQASTEDENL